MVSSSDLAKQVQGSSMRQEAAEAAFKARYSFGSSDAFKQIFQDIETTTRHFAPPKESVKETSPKPVKTDAVTSDTEVKKPEQQQASSVGNKDAEFSQQTHGETTSATSKHHGHVKKASGKHAIHHHTESSAAAPVTNDAKEVLLANSTVKPDISVLGKGDNIPQIVLEPTDGDAVDVASPDPMLADKIVAAIKDGEIVTDDEITANDKDISIVSDATPSDETMLAPILMSHLNLILKMEDGCGDKTTLHVNGMLPLLLNDQQAPSVEPKTTPEETTSEETATTPQDHQDAEDAFSIVLDAQPASVKDAHVKDTGVKDLRKDAKTERATARETTKEANDKHADIIDLLQGKFSAPETHPAASDRAISEALNASDSPAPSLNGTAGGGSPAPGIEAAKSVAGATATGMAIGVEGLPNVQNTQGDQVSFAGMVRNAKDAQASLMTPNEQVAVQLHRMAKSGASHYDLQLHPADLGRVDIRLEISKDGMVQATVTADNQQAFDMLQKDARSLERALQQAGLQTDNDSLNFNLRGDQQSQAQQQQARNNAGNPWNKWMEQTLPEEAAPPKILSFNVNSGNGRVDLRV